MLTCTFFGHKDAPKEIEPTLRSTLIDLIENKKVYNFYVGNHGNFDQMVKRIIIELNEVYHINYAVVLAYLPSDRDKYKEESFVNTVFPDGIECVPLLYAINYRNKWMIEQSDYVITYVKHTVGGAFKFKKLSERKNRIVINIAD